MVRCFRKGVKLLLYEPPPRSRSLVRKRRKTETLVVKLRYLTERVCSTRSSPFAFAVSGPVQVYLFVKATPYIIRFGRNGPFSR